MSAHRAALDHVLTLLAESSWADRMVLRGSMTMPAWVGDAARPPADLDWMVPQPAVTAPDRFRPGPFHDTLRPVQEWPEAVHGAVRNEMWELEEFDTGGRKVRLPPDGLHWVTDLDADYYAGGVDEDLRQLIIDRPWAPGGIVFAPGELTAVTTDDYDEYEFSAGGSHVRVVVPWQAPDFELGTVQVDVSFGERLPEPPVCTAIPRSDGRPPLGLWTPSRELSLAWKLYWLAADQEAGGESAMKDVYDAVLLAESPGLHLSPRLRRIALGTESTSTPLSPGGYLDFAFDDPPPPASPSALLSPSRIPHWTVDGPAPDGGSPAPWLSRLSTAVSLLL